jgi:hypothetical protein
MTTRAGQRAVQQAVQQSADEQRERGEVHGEEALRAAKKLRVEERVPMRDSPPGQTALERQELEEAANDPDMANLPAETRPRQNEGLSGMGALVGDVPVGKDQMDHLERQGLRREEQMQLDRTLAEEASSRVPDTADDSWMEPHEDKGLDR